MNIPGKPSKIDPEAIKSVLKKRPDLADLKVPTSQELEILEVLGKGNFGQVFKARVKPPNVPQPLICAIKVVFLKESELREILLEVDILKMCAHPNITGYVCLFRKELDLWIAMEICDAGGMDHLYHIYPKPLDEMLVASIIYESLKGLDYLHSLFLIHRDIKAGNILLNTQGAIKLADFGVSAKCSTSHVAKSFIGTPYWMAPEVILSEDDHNNRYGPKCDVWSIGITAMELLDKSPPFADIHPFTALKMIKLNEQPILLQKKRSRQCQDFINYCITRDVKRRPTALEALEHPFMLQCKQQDRSAIVREMLKAVGKTTSIPTKKEDSDDEVELPEQPPADKKINKPVPTMRVAKQGEVVNTKISFVVQECVTCVDFYGPYLIIGTETGLIVGDAMDPNFEYFGYVIPKTAFKDLFVLEEYGVMLAICGRTQHVRQYKLSTLKRLIRYGMTGDEQYLKTSDSQLNLDQSFLKTIFTKSNDQKDYFIKIPNSRDTSMIKLSKTATSAYVGMTNKSMLTILEWAKAPYNRFMKTKSFWLPESPKFFCLINNGKFIHSIVMGYANEANSIDYETSKVTDISVNSTVVNAINNKKTSKWVHFDQMPFDDDFFNTLKKRAMAEEDKVNIKMQAVVNPYKKGEGLKNVPCLATYGDKSYFCDENGKIQENSQLFEWRSIPLKIVTVKDLLVIGYLEDGIQVFTWTGALVQYFGFSQDCKYKTNCQKGKYLVAISQRKKKECYIDLIGDASKPLA